MNARMPDIRPDDRYTTAQAAALLGVSRQSIWRWSNSGLLTPRHCRRTGKPRYTGRDLLAFWRREF